MIIIDDGSTDDTVHRIPKAVPFRVISSATNHGKGYAVRTGILASRTKRVLFTDADLATPLTELTRLEQIMDQGFDVVIASRALKTSRSITSQSKLRQLASILFGALSKVLFVRGIADTQCGFKLFTKEAAQVLFSQTTSSTPLFDMEVLMLAGKHTLRVAEVACTWKHHPDSRLRYNLVSALGLHFELVVLKVHHRVWFPVNVKATIFE